MYLFSLSYFKYRRVNGFNSHTSTLSSIGVSMPSKASGYTAGVAESTQPYSKWDADRDEVEVDYKQMGNGDAVRRRSSRWFSGRKGIVLRILLLVVIFLSGLIVGNLLRKTLQTSPDNEVCSSFISSQSHSQEISNAFAKSIDALNIRKNLNFYTRMPHPTATHHNQVILKHLVSDFKSYGLQTRTASYNVLLSYHDWGLENVVSLLNSNGSMTFQTTYHGPDMGAPNANSHPILSEPYNAFSPNGTVEGELIYANFGEESDFNLLKEQGISCEGKIIIMRYGRIFRGKKVQNAEKCGAIGALLYSDPAQVVDFHDPNVFPESWNLPGWASQRGSILPEIFGDPLTPGFPSKAGMPRVAIKDAILPKIPVQPIGYDDAHMIMMHMKGPIDNSFLGNMHENISYNMGPGYLTPRTNWTVKLEVFNEMENRDITNVFGIIEGRDEPDRYVIIGCHYDAWTFGAVDPNSGTAVLMEIAKSYGVLVQDGWQPRRTIIFAHWDAEEQGLMGSYEWVEDHAKELSDKTVMYINLDGAVRGNATLKVMSSPFFRQLMTDITSSIPPAVEENAESLLDAWTRVSPSSKNSSLPEIHLIGSGSDHAPFTFTLGVPSLFAQYDFDNRKTSLKTTPAYHTALDRMSYMVKFIDPTFRAHYTMARVIGEFILRVSSFDKLPFDLRELASLIEEECNGLNAIFSDDNLPHLSNFGQLVFRVGNLTTAASAFHFTSSQIDSSNILAVRRHNDAIQRVSSCFILNEGLPGRPQYKNIMFAPSALDAYSPVTFPGIRDALSSYQKDSTFTWTQVEKQVSVAILAIECATHTLSGELFN